jgi:sigma54-dependent transcription regulator
MDQTNYNYIVYKLQKEKDELLILLKKQLDIANEGFKNTIELIKDFGVYEE